MDFNDILANQIDLLTNIANNLRPVNRLIIAAAYIIGLSFAFKAIYSLKVYGEARTMMASNASVKEPIIYLMIAAIFIYFPTALQMLLNTTFGYSNILEYASVNNGRAGIFGGDSPFGRPLALLIQTIGLIAFVRGWVLIARSASQGQPPGGTGKGLMHVFGGILAMNIFGTLEVINNTLYGV